MLGALHVSSYVAFIEPNSVSNWYHKSIFLGRGFGAWSYDQLLQVNYIKTQLGSEFQYKEIIDDNKMLDPTKMEKLRATKPYYIQNSFRYCSQQTKRNVNKKNRIKYENLINFYQNHNRFL